MNRSVGRWIAILFLAVVAAAAAWYLSGRGPGETRSAGEAARPAPVEAAPVTRGPITLQRTFSGELEARAQFVVAPKVGGRVVRMHVRIADTVQRGQIVAELDDDEYAQAVLQAEADLAVAGANLSEATSALTVAEREFKRTQKLVKQGIASASEFDAAAQNRMEKQSRVQVSEAQVTRAESSLKIAKIRLGYTRVNADWSGGDEVRVVAERYVDEGQTVAANDPLLLIVEPDPIIGIVYVSERDYALLSPGQPVSLTTEAYPGERFSGRIGRVAPVFRKSTRQARVEMTIDNPKQRLKPGMFIRALVVLDREPSAVIVPEQALTRRNDRQGVFIVSPDGRSALWREVTVGIREGERVQVIGEGLTGRVVTLGQQLIEDGSAITVSEPASPAPAPDDGEGK